MDNRLAVRLSPRSGILLFLLFTLLLTLELQPGVPVVPAATAVMPALQLGAFLLAAPFLKLRLKSGPLPVVLALWTALFCWSLLSAFWSGYAPLTLMRSLIVFVTPGLLLLMVFSDPQPEETFLKFARIMSWFGTLLSLVALLLFFAGRTVRLDQWEGLQLLDFGPLELAQSVHFIGPLARPSSLTGNPNILATWLIFSLLSLLALFAARRLSLSGLALLGGLQAPVLLMTLSRTSIGAAVFATALFIFFLSRDSAGRFAKGAFLAAAATAGAAIFLSRLFESGGAAFLVRSTTVLSRREVIWSTAWEAIQARPLTGAGFGVTSEAILEEAGLGVVHLHNVYLSVLLEIGLIGLAVFIGLWLAALTGGLWKLLLPPRPEALREKVVPAAVFSLLAALTIHQLLETMILFANSYTALWIYLIGVATHPKLHGDMTNFTGWRYTLKRAGKRGGLHEL